MVITPDLTNMKMHWKMPLTIHGEFEVQIHWESDNHGRVCVQSLAVLVHVPIHEELSRLLILETAARCTLHAVL